MLQLTWGGLKLPIWQLYWLELDGLDQGRNLYHINVFISPFIRHSIVTDHIENSTKITPKSVPCCQNYVLCAIGCRHDGDM